MQYQFLDAVIEFEADGVDGEPEWADRYQMKFQFVRRAFLLLSRLTLARALGTFLPAYSAILRMISPMR